LPLSRVFISPEEVYPGKKPTYDEVAALAAELNRQEALHFLGYLNLLLASATAETHLTNRLEPVHEVQTWLFREVVGETLLRDLKAKFRDASLLDRPVLHRAQVLFAIRLVATHGTPDGGNKLVERRDFDAIGDLLFLINGLFHPEPLTSDAAKALWLATQMGPIYELENPPDVELAWPRTQELLSIRFPQAAHNAAELQRLEQVSDTTGFSMQAWIDLSWMLFSYWVAVSFKELMKNRGRGYLNPVQPHEAISSESLQRALNGLAVGFDELPSHLRINAFSGSTLFDLSPFRIKPLWLMPDGLVLCIDPVMLLERLGPHVFWSVMNALDSKAARHQFTGTWGKAFENYSLEVLGTVFRAKKWLYTRNPIDAETNEELADATAVRDGTAIVVECKGTFITSANKYSGRPTAFMRGLTQKFGRSKHGGVYQLVRTISKVWYARTSSGAVAHSQKATDVFPILVLQDPIFACGPVARVVSDRFQVGIERARRKVTHKTPTVWPLTVITADELDWLGAALSVKNARLDALLKRFHRLYPSRMISLGEFLSSNTADFFDSAKVRENVNNRFRAKTEGTMERFKNGDYGGA